eukprot:TRINITY_DN29942_c0_g1_i1.p1 TRINITY_DN29942_c0_g1~~TRINITY_DN29942_c0_g1_i1.p1  ORF type:complete len:591 (-),score=77.20 TRINITY_DN29942_c0_g1_i1:214-1986(-)
MHHASSTRQKEGGPGAESGVSQRPTLRRLRHRMHWAIRQFRESQGSPPQWQSLVLDEVVRDFLPWTQAIFALQAQGQANDTNDEALNVFLHLAPLYYLLQLPCFAALAIQAADVITQTLDANAADAICVERCRVTFPAILEVISAIDRLTECTKERVMHRLSNHQETLTLTPKTERRQRLQQIVAVLRQVLEWPDAKQALPTPTPTRINPLNSVGRGALAYCPDSCNSDADGYFSCSEGEQESKDIPCAAVRLDTEDAMDLTDMQARAKLDAMWEKLHACPASSCTYSDPVAMMKDFQGRNYSSLLDSPADLHPEGVEKVICSAGGVVAPVRLHWRKHITERFTGMFRRADYGLIRCSSITEPQTGSRWSLYPSLIPMVALKFFRDGKASSANLVFAHKKSGHNNPNFLSHAVSNHFTENVVPPFTAMLKVFQKYSDFPTFTGCAEFASETQSGAIEGNPVAPYAIVLLPPETQRTRKVKASKHLLDQFAGFSAGDVLYEVHLVPEPNKKGISAGMPKPIWRAGELVLLKAFISSDLADRKLRFQHHVFENDLQLRSDWRAQADKMIGAPFYEELIEAGQVWDEDTSSIG